MIDEVGCSQRHQCSQAVWSGHSTSHPNHDVIIKWKHFLPYWPFVWGTHRSPVNSPHKGQWHGALMFSLICAWTNGWGKQSRHWSFEMPSCLLWRHCNVYVNTPTVAELEYQNPLSSLCKPLYARVNELNKPVWGGGLYGCIWSNVPSTRRIWTCSDFSSIVWIYTIPHKICMQFAVTLCNSLWGIHAIFICPFFMVGQIM